MGRKAYVFYCIVAVAVLGGCATERSAKESTNAPVVRDKIQGKALIVLSETNQADKALSAGGSAIYLWEGMTRYRLFVRKPVELEGGKEYTAEGIIAQKVIDEIGDPDQGKNGYPLLSSCRRVVKTVWPNMALDVTDGYVMALRDRVRRYPARPVFLVTKIQPLESKAAAAKPEDADVPEVSVAADKQKALLVEGPTVLPAPLWEPAGQTVRCKLLIDVDGKVSELQTGAQLCESVPWSQFRYKPTVQKGHPVKVKTEVEIRFEPRKATTS